MNLRRRLFLELRARTSAGERARRKLVASGVLTVGASTYGQPEIVDYPGDTAGVTIGSFVSIADGVRIFRGGNHRTDWITTYPLRAFLHLPGAFEDGVPTTKGDVVIGNDVWLGYGATILSGVRIGDGAVVGAGAVVTRDVRPYAVVAGNPAREVRRRFSDEVVEQLQAAAWWTWPIEEIRAHVDVLSSDDVEALLRIAAGRGS